MTMEMWLGLIIIGTGIQGFVLTFYLLTSNKAQVEANSILSLVVFSLSVDIFTAFLPGLNGSVQGNPTILLYGPLAYLYVVSLCGPSSPGMRKFTYAVIFVYAIPIVLYLLNVIRQFAELTQTGSFPFQMKHEFFGVDIFQLTPAVMIVFVLSTAGFLFLASREVRLYYHKAQNQSSSGAILNTVRTQFVLYVLVFSLLAFLILYLMTGSRILSAENAYQILRWGMTLSIYALGYITLKKSNLLLFTFTPNGPDKQPDEQSETPDITESKEKFKTVRDSVLKERLLDLMKKQRPYLDADLSLQTLANQLNVQPKMLSALINSDLGCNFFDFVSKYRVADVKTRLADKSSINKTIMVIAYECGFNTKSSFNAVFRKFEQVTPTEFRNGSFRTEEKIAAMNSAQEMK
ncbi:MAG: helix-turn-helix domain-containing protein [Fibrobacterota bacterium]